MLTKLFFKECDIMKFVSTSESAIMKAAMAHLFLKNAYEEKRLNEISNMDEVLEALDPMKVLDSFLNDTKKTLNK